MLRELRRLLSGVRSRGRKQRSGDGFMGGVVLGALLGMAVESARLFGVPVAPWAAWAAVFGCAAGGGLMAFMLPFSWRRTARLVDQHYGLKDRALTALEFAARPEADPLIRLQIEEATEHLRQVVPRAVLPRRVPAYSRLAATLTVSLLGLALLPRHATEPEMVDSLIQQVVNEQAANLEETMVDELRELAKEMPEPELQELAEEMEQLVKELQSSDVDQRQALSKLSEMQQELAAALEQFNTEKTDAALKELAAALEPAEAMQAITEALKQGEYDKAAEKFEKINADSLTRKQRDAVAANLKKFRENLADGSAGELSESAREMEQGLESDNQAEFQKGACKAAGVCKSQGLKKKIGQCLNCQLNRLAECKGQCQNPGQCNSEGPAKKSNSPSTKAGKAASNQPTGDAATRLDSERQRQNLSGLQGDGPSERETSQSPEGEQDSARSYAQRYTEFRKQMEQVLESEPLPLGHRETVRKYFESIRPDTSDVTE